MELAKRKVELVEKGCNFKGCDSSSVHIMCFRQGLISSAY